jgi:predicted enzyme related to lactoylglutathione lyase
MRLLTVTVLQQKAKYQLAQYFYGEILGLPHAHELDARRTRWFTHPVLLESHCVDPTELQQPRGGFTGIQLNVYPLREVHQLVNSVRRLGYKLPDARLVDDKLVATVQDPTGNAILVVGHRDPPEEPLSNQSIGALTVFVSSLAHARPFYEGVLGLPFVAAPPGMLVFGEPGGTALLLYQAQRGLPETPVGRLTPYTLGTTDLVSAAEAIERSDGTIVQRVTHPETGALERIVFKDPERNTFALVDETALELPEPLPVDPIAVEVALEPMDRGAALELDAPAEPVAGASGDDDDIPPFDRELELD